ncbi:MAG: P-II family nitrogen regulator [Acidimicrobiia bacterium]|nr:P-II family nitrogen regulator [Acidimicrobiia bacterium]
MLELLTAIIKTHRLDEVKEALANVGVSGLTVTEVRGFGRQGGHTEVYRGAEYKVDFVPKLKVEVLCASADVDSIAEAIAKAAGSGTIGDGKIWTNPVNMALRIRTGERGIDAV